LAALQREKRNTRGGECHVNNQQLAGEGVIQVGQLANKLEDAGTDELRDAIIAVGATKAEHYEMISYADLIDGAEC
jgi:ferritin-like metal-binding protein YciE